MTAKINFSLNEKGERMKLIREERGKCEMGGCRKKAEYSIRMDRIGIKSRIYICKDCVGTLYRILGEEIVPKSIETVRKKESLKI